MTLYIQFVLLLRNDTSELLRMLSTTIREKIKNSTSVFYKFYFTFLTSTTI